MSKEKGISSFCHSKSKDQSIFSGYCSMEHSVPTKETQIAATEEPV